jgi:hypothetical protein
MGQIAAFHCKARVSVAACRPHCRLKPSIKEILLEDVPLSRRLSVAGIRFRHCGEDDPMRRRPTYAQLVVLRLKEKSERSGLAIAVNAEIAAECEKLGWLNSDGRLTKAGLAILETYQDRRG